MKNLLLIGFVSVLAFSCNPLNKINFSAHQPFDETLVSDELSVEFNGVANFYIQHKGNAVLTDPFISNPSMGKVMFGKIESNTELIDKFQPKSHNISMVCIGHAHYDHILDLPYFAPYLNKDARILGSNNAVALSKTLNLEQQLIPVNDMLATALKPGHWIYNADSTVRIMPAKSAHLPHIMGLHLYHGEIKKELTDFPNKGKQFVQDETIAYLIDFLEDDKSVSKRVYFASSAVAFPNGYFPLRVLNEKSVDLAILSAALYQKAENYPEQLIRYIQPEKTIFCHWENFFRTREKPLQPVSLTRVKRLIKNTEKLNKLTEVHFIKPGDSWGF